jgi:uncharacterized membrane protein HdeD (DUF308 family)
MKKYSPEKEAKYLSILVIIIGIILIILAFFPENLTTQILMKIIITFLIASGIAFWVRNKNLKKNK